jgi:hypothetical protein
MKTVKISAEMLLDALSYLEDWESAMVRPISNEDAYYVMTDNKNVLEFNLEEERI